MQKKILVVEDDTFLLDAYTLKLSQTPFEIKTARNGEDALELVSSFRPDLVILDMVMPKMGGLEFLQRLRSTPEISETPVIIATNLDRPELWDEAKKYNVKDYFVKSEVSIADLITQCKKVLGES